MSRGEESKRVVCVTGASSYIASWLGYTVNATVRNLYDPAKTEHLMGLEGAKERLHLFKADLMEKGSFDPAISGCQGVFHVASPVNFRVNDPQVDVLDPAVKGTLNVIVTCKRNPSVRRVILTSSLSSVLLNAVARPPEMMVDESWFSKPEYYDEYPTLKWYVMSKIMAEEAAWKFCKENNIDLINGAETYPNVALPWIHIRAFEMPSAHGRYCLVERVVHHSEIVKLLHELHDHPSLQIPHKCADDGSLVKTYQVSKAKVKSLGIDFIPLRVSVKDTVESIKDKKFLSTSQV